MLKLLKKRWYLFLIVLLVGGFFIYRQATIQPAVKQASAYKVQSQTLKDSLSFSGEIDADEKATLRFQSSGKLAWVGVKEGDVVKKYQGVASLDQKDLQLRLKRYLNTFMKTRWNFDQTKDDYKDSNILGLSDDARRKAYRVIDESQFDLNNSVIDVELQQIALNDGYLYSPIEGIVTRVEAPLAGLNITPTQAEFDVINPKTIYFSAAVDQTDIGKLSVGKVGDITLDAYPDETIPAKVVSVGFIPKAGETGTVYQVKIQIPQVQDADKYRMGMTGDINFVLKERANVIAVPSSYVKTEGKDKYVLKTVQGKTVKQVVKIGDTLDNSTIITSGLQEGDVVYD
ncbi:efflux RND transporter periplasmic adaptor subunit [Candidatus Roizmanbacteria bacterium]|nr:efflux RND transporter periplasmic adaptor subunit [Candidatus Roizmanbacteria bacterium]